MFQHFEVSQSSILCLRLLSAYGKHGPFPSGMFQHSWSHRYSRWHLGSWNLWQKSWGDRSGLRTNQSVRAAGGDRSIPCHLHSYYRHPLSPTLSLSSAPHPPLIALRLLEEVAHLSAPRLSFLHLPSSPSASFFAFSPPPLFYSHYSHLNLVTKEMFFIS